MENFTHVCFDQVSLSFLPCHHYYYRHISRVLRFFFVNLWNLLSAFDMCVNVGPSTGAWVASLQPPQNIGSSCSSSYQLPLAGLPDVLLFRAGILSGSILRRLSQLPSGHVDNDPIAVRHHFVSLESPSTSVSFLLCSDPWEEHSVFCALTSCGSALTSLYCEKKHLCWSNAVPT